MPITGISTDYTGRTKDISIFQGVNPFKPTVVSPSFGQISNYCAGVQKLIQRYAISLLTELGSQTYFQDFGTDLIGSLLRTTAKINKADVNPIFNFANLTVIQNFRNYQRATQNLPTDEQIDTAKLISVNVVGDAISLSIQIYPLTGAPVVFLVPLPAS